MSTMHQLIAKNAKRLIVCSFLLILSLFCFSITSFAETIAVDPEILSFTADKTIVDVGSSVKFTTIVKSGTGEPSFIYTFKANETTIKTIASSNRTESYSWTPTETGTYSIKTVVKDSNAKVSYKIITITVSEISTEPVTETSTEVERFNTISEADFLLMLLLLLLLLIFICAIKFFVL